MKEQAPEVDLTLPDSFRAEIDTLTGGCRRLEIEERTVDTLDDRQEVVSVCIAFGPPAWGLKYALACPRASFCDPLTRHQVLIGWTRQLRLALEESSLRVFEATSLAGKRGGKKRRKAR